MQSIRAYGLLPMARNSRLAEGAIDVPVVRQEPIFSPTLSPYQPDAAAVFALPSPAPAEGLWGQLRTLLKQLDERDRLARESEREPGQAPSAPAGAAGTGAGTYTVQSGDSLWAIASRLLGDGSRWPEIHDLNRDTLGDNPNLIYRGQVLRLPAGASAPPPRPEPPETLRPEPPETTPPGPSVAPSEPSPTPRPGPRQPWQPGPGRLEGADTSHWQTDEMFQKAIRDTKWTALKATQGTRFVDAKFRSRWDLLGQKLEDGSLRLRMAYHFLDSGDGAAQARHFLEVLGVNGPLPPGTRLALDWEGPALGSPETLRDAANYIYQVTGTWPVVYVSASKQPVVQRTVPEAPLWVAAWSRPIDPNVPFFQYSDGPGYDRDVFNGDLAALERFAGWS